MKKLMIAMAVLAATIQAIAMPTRAELSNAGPLVNELMAPVLEEFKSSADRTAAAAVVGERASAFAAEAETEAAKFLLLKGAINYYVRGEAYDKAADCIATMQSDIAALTPDAVLEIVGKAVNRISGSKAPRLLAYYRAAKLQVRARKELPVLEKKLKRVKSEQLQRQYAEALAISGNWKAAYDAFAKLRDKDLAQMAEAEAKGSAANEQSAELWWNYKPEFEDAENFFKAHAVEFYQKALEKGEISGLKKNIVERRIAQINEEAAAVNVADASTAAARSPSSTTAKRGKSIKVKIKNGVELEFIPCPAGTFTMGTATFGNKPTNPNHFAYKHEVTISRPFWMSKYPITVEQFGAFCPIDDAFIKRNGKQGEAKAPVCLRIGHVEDYCNWLNGRFASALPRKCIFRLPTDAEWEYAFFANSTDKDDPYVRLRDGEKAAMYEICGTTFPVPVGTAGKPNAWGLYDMLGNGCHYLLDTVNGEYVKGGNRYEVIDSKKMASVWSYNESETDPLRLYVPDEKGHAARHLMRGGLYLTWSKNRGPNVYIRMAESGLINCDSDCQDRPRIWTFRVVIGPDIVSEWMAKNGKK
ncbi:MAG: formylglycine-generating enzyme family protein [Kiritimatiellae bacterium]|nr:formylglycine-generating enzyme family protein [Kiritimatiellia bacterium]